MPKIELAGRFEPGATSGRHLIFLAIEGRAYDAIALSVFEIAGQALVPAVLQAPVNESIPAAWVRGVARLGQRLLVVVEPSVMAVV